MKKLLLILPLPALGVWLLWQFGTGLDANHACLMISAKRLLAGGSMEADFNFPTPPLCILLYAIPVLMAKYLFIPAYYTPYVFGLCCLALSLLAMHRILRHWPQPDDEGKTVFLYAFLIANTLLTSSTYFYFGERDQIVLLGLYPFLLVQLALTWRYEMPRGLVWAVLIPGAAAILIKPQFGLLPVLALIHRAVAQKRFSSIMRDADFIALAGMVIVNIAVTLVRFPGYFTADLPEFARFYLTMENPDTVLIFVMYAAATASAAAFGMTWGVEAKRMKLAFIAYFAAMVCLLLFLVQMKGFYYHLIPAFVFLMTAIALQLNEIARHFFRGKWYATPGIVAVLFVAAIALKSEGTTALRHADYARTPLAKLVSGCAPHCSYLIFSEDVEKVPQIEIYTGATYASRFPMLWWLPGLVAGLDRDPGNRTLAGLKARYVHDVAVDIQRYKPAVMAFVSNLAIGSHKHFDIVAFFSSDPLFRQELQDYNREAPFKDNRRNYFRHPVMGDDVPLVYDVYRRK